MIHKPLKLLFSRISRSQSSRNSALFINGAKATDTFVYVTPHIDYDVQIKDKHILARGLQRRKANIDLNKLESLWSVYFELKQRKSDFEKKKSELSRELGKIMKTEPDSNDAKKYKIQIDLVKDNIKKLKVPLWSAEENAAIEFLKLPNTIHPFTPDESHIISACLKPATNNKDHLKMGKDLNILNFKKNENYYLSGDAAIFELGAKFYFSNILKKKQFVQFSNPDFVKSVIVEGCGDNHTDSDCTFILHHNEDTGINIDSRLHLTGGGSLSSFMAYHAKNVIYAKTLPLKYFSMGRQYVPAPSDEDSLFHVSQCSVVQTFAVARDSEEVSSTLEELTNILEETYTKLGFHFRLSYVPAHKLLMWESLRLSVEMYSSSLKSYVEVGNISVSGDFISKRLMFTYMNKKESKFPHILSGTILNVPKLLACVLEQDGDFAVPQPFQVENWAL